MRKLSAELPQDKPFLITEIGCKALYGFRDPLKTRWSEEYQAQVPSEGCDYVLNDDNCAGLAIWQFADTRSYVNGPDIYGRTRGFNNKGVLDEYRRPKLAWYALKECISGSKYFKPNGRSTPPDQVRGIRNDNAQKKRLGEAFFKEAKAGGFSINGVMPQRSAELIRGRILQKY